MMILPYRDTAVKKKIQALLNSAYKESSYSETSTQECQTLRFRSRYVVHKTEINPCKQIRVCHETFMDEILFLYL
jgi:hypothetical protein